MQQTTEQVSKNTKILNHSGHNGITLELNKENITTNSNLKAHLLIARVKNNEKQLEQH